MLCEIVIILFWNFKFGFLTYYNLHYIALLIMVSVNPVGLVTSFLQLIYGAWSCITNFCSTVVEFLILDLNGVLLQNFFCAN